MARQVGHVKYKGTIGAFVVTGFSKIMFFLFGVLYLFRDMSRWNNNYFDIYA
jgi:hypothetical protein